MNEDQLTEIHDEVRAYMPSLMIRLVIGYGVPILGVVLISFLLQVFLPQAIPTSTRTILAFGAYLLFLYFGWKVLESWTHATELFVLYSSYSAQRRHLQQEQENAPSLSDVRTTAENFTRAAQTYGLQPRGKN